MSSPNDFESIFNKYRHNPDIVIKSRDWFNKLTLRLSNVYINDNNLFKNSNLEDRMQPGKMYLYRYDPKHKATLPYYDKFPLVMPYRFTSSHFIGLNFHYLGYYQRIRLLSKLMQFANNSRMNEHTRVLYNWELIKSAAKFPEVQFCIKEYLVSHVRSKFIEIEPKDWHTALMLPIARFSGKNQQEIWAASSRRN